MMSSVVLIWHLHQIVEDKGKGKKTLWSIQFNENRNSVWISCDAFDERLSLTQCVTKVF